MNRTGRCLADSLGEELPRTPFATAASTIPSTTAIVRSVAAFVSASSFAVRALHPAHRLVLVAPTSGVRTSFVRP